MTDTRRRLAWGLVALAGVGTILVLNRQAAKAELAPVVWPAGLQMVQGAPTGLPQLKGRVVVLDFFTVGCINCQHMLPVLKALEAKHGARLAVLGVHAGKFSGERDPARLALAMRRLQVPHPVVNDPDFALWKAYGIKAWPSFVVLDAEGREAARFEGEGVGPQLDAAIAKALTSAPARPPTMATAELPSLPPSPLAFPQGLAVRPGLVAVADTGHHRIVLATPEGNVIAVVGDGQPGLLDGPGRLARFREPLGLAFQGDRLLVADRWNHALRAIDLKQPGYPVRTLMGDGRQGSWGAGEIEQSSVGRLNSPWALAPLADGSVAIAEAGAHRLRRFDADGRHVRPMVGSGQEELRDGPPRLAGLAQPSGLALGEGDRLWFVDAESSALREFSLKPDGTVQSAVGSGLFDWGDAGKLEHPQGLAFGFQKLWIADTYNDKLKVYDPRLKVLATVPGPQGADGLARPGAVAVGEGKLWVADTDHQRIMVGAPDGPLAPWPILGLNLPSPADEAPSLRPSQRVTSGGPVDVVLRTLLPAGHHLNLEAGGDILWRLERASGAGQSGEAKWAANGTAAWRLPALGDRPATLSVRLSHAWCRNDGTGPCRPHDAHLSLGLMTEAGWPGRLSLEDRVSLPAATP